MSSTRRRCIRMIAGAPLLGACATTSRLDFRLPDSFCGTTLPPASDADAAQARYRIAAIRARRTVAGADTATDVWTYADAQRDDADSPLIRARQGEVLPVLFENRLPAPTTVHWHGLRLHNAMDGVPAVTQAAIAPGARHLYRLACRDAGTYWYHPHQAAHEQVARGLGGAFVVDEDRPPEVDHDWVWLLKDWLVDADGQIRGDFEDVRDMSHAGRIGNRVTLNGQPSMHAANDASPLSVAAGSRVRLRLVNASSARSFVLAFESDRAFAPKIAALDGFPCPLHEPPDGQITLAAAQRVDLLFDMPDGRVRIRDVREPRRAFTLRELVASRGRSGGAPRAPIAALPPNPWREPDLARARSFDVMFEGGARGQLRSGRVGQRTLSAAQLLDEFNMAWTVNGTASREHEPAPFLRVACGDSVVLRMRNDSAWQHPIHLHGFHFRVLAVDGRAPNVTTIRDTVMMEPRSRVDIAFVADNPGLWMFHCHILQHQAGGMMAVLQVD